MESYGAMVFSTWFSLKNAFLRFISWETHGDERRQTEASCLSARKGTSQGSPPNFPLSNHQALVIVWFPPQEQPMPFPSSLPHSAPPHHLSCPKAGLATETRDYWELRGLESVSGPAFTIQIALGR